jgi:hypothetical protein
MMRRALFIDGCCVFGARFHFLELFRAYVFVMEGSVLYVCFKQVLCKGAGGFRLAAGSGLLRAGCAEGGVRARLVPIREGIVM